MAKNKFDKLFTPCNIGRVKLKNRLVKTANQTYLFKRGEKRVGQLVKAFYGALAKGRHGLDHRRDAGHGMANNEIKDRGSPHASRQRQCDTGH